MDRPVVDAESDTVAWSIKTAGFKDQHLSRHMSHVFEFVFGEADLRCAPAQSVCRDSSNLLDYYPAPTGGDINPVDPATTFHARQQQHTDQLTHGDVQVKPGRDDKRRPIFALFTTSNRFKVNEPHVSKLNRWLGH
jgi:hypothetical protein